MLNLKLDGYEGCEITEGSPDLTELEAEDLLERLRVVNLSVATAKERYEAFVDHYQAKIEKAKNLFNAETAGDRAEIEAITNRLERYALKHITGKKRSITLPSGTLRLTKQQPRFFIGGEPVTNDNPALIALARRLDTALVKTVETADWAELKKRLATDDEGKVFFFDTGENLPDLTVQSQPDKFTVKTAD